MSKVEQLAADLKKQTPGDQLRIAAELCDQGRYETARIIAKSVVDEMTLLKLFGKLPGSAR